LLTQRYRSLSRLGGLVAIGRWKSVSASEIRTNEWQPRRDIPGILGGARLAPLRDALSRRQLLFGVSVVSIVLLAASAAHAQQCTPGTFSFTGQMPCQPCTPGLFQPAAGATFCEQCARGSFSASPGATMCTLCSPGTAQPLPGTQSCVACAPGTFTNIPGSQTCNVCPPGTVATQPGSPACTACPNGTVPNQGRTQCIAAASAVPALAGWWTAALALALSAVALSVGRHRRKKPDPR